MTDEAAPEKLDEDTPPMAEVIEPPTPAEEPPLDAVLVIRQEVEGRIETKIVLNGDVRATEVETLLKLGLQGWQRQIGV